jgi:hypothetical protein
MKFILLDELYSFRNYSSCFVSRSPKQEAVYSFSRAGKVQPLL